MKALAAEMVQKFSRQLQCLGIAVRELTGDMQLTKREIENTQVGVVRICVQCNQSEVFTRACLHPLIFVKCKY